VLISEGPGILIGKCCFLGPAVHIYDSDFHAVDVSDRGSGEPRRGLVVIEEDVFVGARATILKGVRSGAGSVVGAGAAVTTDVAAGLIVAGNPAQAIRS
jgi:maltose O-acetyltransferase